MELSSFSENWEARKLLLNVVDSTCTRDTNLPKLLFLFVYVLISLLLVFRTGVDVVFTLYYRYLLLWEHVWSLLPMPLVESILTSLLETS